MPLTPRAAQASVGVPRRPHLPGDLLPHLQAGLRLPHRHSRACVQAGVPARVHPHAPLPVCGRVCRPHHSYHHQRAQPPVQGGAQPQEGVLPGSEAGKHQWGSV